jgi:hypothetical protein
LLLLGVSACSTGTHVAGDAAAIAVCRGQHAYRGSKLRAAYTTTVGEIAAWMDAKQPPNWGHVQLPYETDHDAGERVSLCWIDGGALAFPGVRQETGTPRAAIVIDAEKEVTFLIGGHAETKDGHKELFAEDPGVRAKMATEVRVAVKHGPAGEVLLPAYRPRKLEGIAWDRLGIAGDSASGCVWITFTDGYRFAALWPMGWAAKFAPLRIYDQAGTLVWSEGELRGVTGEQTKDEDIFKVPTACRSSGDWAHLVGSIGSVSA